MIISQQNIFLKRQKQLGKKADFIDDLIAKMKVRDKKKRITAAEALIEFNQGLKKYEESKKPS